MSENRAKRCTFEQWLKQLFDHDAHDFDTYYTSLNGTYWCNNSAAREILYVTQAFENAESVFAPYSNMQLRLGFWYLISSSSTIMFPLVEKQVTWRDKERCIRSFYSVFEQLFARRCSPGLCHLGSVENPLNGICYMWWDIFPFWGSLTEPSRIDDLFLDVMVATLKLDSDACRESALHGLGHFPHRDRIDAIISNFLRDAPDISPELREYALHASYGGVL